MMDYVLSMIGSAALIGCAVQSVRELTGTGRLTWLPVASMMLSFVAVGELSLGRWIHSFTGYLSIPLILLLAWYCVKPLMFQDVHDQPIHRRYWWLMLIVGSFYLPAAIGLGDFDPHALGWQPEFIWVPIVLAIAMISVGDYWLAAMVVTSMLAWQWNWLGTSNGWSYLLDPIAVGFSVFGIVAAKLKSLRLQRTSAFERNNPSEEHSNGHANGLATKQPTTSNATSTKAA